MAFLWTPDLETGNFQIDTEHKKLIEAINSLLNACAQGKGRQELASATDFLLNYTKTHFAHEQKLQEQCKYPEYIMHKSWHTAFIAQVEAICIKLKSEGPTIAILGEVNGKISLLISHIKREDSKLAKYIKANSK